MKKSLLALAVFGAVAGAASAQSSVTIYGVADVGINHNSGSYAAGNKTSMENGMQAPSRLGFKGREDLGGGLSATFNLENGFNVDNGGLAANNVLFNRQAWVGLNGNFGSVQLGRQESPLYAQLDALDPFGTSGAGSALNMFPAVAINERTSNTINYKTLSLGGFTGEFAYVLGETAGSTSANNQYGLALGYANGPLAVKFGYNRANATGTAFFQDLGLATAVDADLKSALLTGSYDFGVAKLLVAHGEDKLEGTPAVVRGKSNSSLVGVSVPFGAGTVLASYSRLNIKNVADADADQIAVGYSYALSKRTSLYTTYARISNDRFSRVGLVDTASGNTAKNFNVGIRHAF
jgi:predicted porin